ncbi:MAG TPA: hypothetical protein VF719_13710 [Abditibacteriaceae bacterium]|jgi:hypothetical protein
MKRVFFVICLLLCVSRVYPTLASTPIYSPEARDKVVASMIATAKQLKPIAQPAPRKPDDDPFPTEQEEAYRERISPQIDFLVALAQMGEDEAAWNAARQLKLDSIQAKGTKLRVTLAYAAALHWIAAGDISRALKTADFLATPELTLRENELGSGNTLQQYQADIWLNAANRLVQQGKREESRTLLMRTAPSVRAPNHFGARGYFAWILGQTGDKEGAFKELAETRRQLVSAVKKELDEDQDGDDAAWLAVWHLRAGLEIEAAEIARLVAPQAKEIPSYLNGKTQYRDRLSGRVSDTKTALLPFTDKLLIKAQNALKQGKRIEARRYLRGADMFASLIEPDVNDSFGKNVRAQLRYRSAALYAALGDVKQAALQRKEANKLSGTPKNIVGSRHNFLRTTEKLEPHAQLQIWLQVLRSDGVLDRNTAMGRRDRATAELAIRNALRLTRRLAVHNGTNNVYPSVHLTRALFKYGYNAQAREIARVALNRAMSRDIWIYEMMETVPTAKILLDHSPRGSADYALVQKFLSAIRRYSVSADNSPAYALLLAQSDWLNEAVIMSKLSPGDEQRVSSIYAQKRGALATLNWVNQIKDARHRAKALAAISAVLADQRDKQLPEPLFRWVNMDATDIQAVD